MLPGNAPRYGGQQGREADMTELLATGEQTGGALGLFRQTIAPGSGPPTHLHGMEAEFAYVVSGQFNFKLGERVVSVPPGSFIFIPRKTPAHLQECRHGAGCVAVRCDTWRARDDVRGAAGCGCGNEQEADANASRGSRGATAPVASSHPHGLEVPHDQDPAPPPGSYPRPHVERR